MMNKKIKNNMNIKIEPDILDKLQKIIDYMSVHEENKMTNLEHIKSMSADELAVWLDECTYNDNTPWSKWFDNRYCQKCEPEIAYASYLNKELEFSYCELNDFKCKFFPELNEVPDYKQIIEMWLESEYEE